MCGPRLHAELGTAPRNRKEKIALALAKPTALKPNVTALEPVCGSAARRGHLSDKPLGGLLLIWIALVSVCAGVGRAASLQAAKEGLRAEPWV